MMQTIPSEHHGLLKLCALLCQLTQMQSFFNWNKYMLRLFLQNEINSDVLETSTEPLLGTERPKVKTIGHTSTTEHGEPLENSPQESGDACSLEADRFLTSLQATQTREEAIEAISWHGRKYIGSGEDCYA